MKMWSMCLALTLKSMPFTICCYASDLHNNVTYSEVSLSELSRASFQESVDRTALHVLLPVKYAQNCSLFVICLDHSSKSIFSMGFKVNCLEFPLGKKMMVSTEKNE